MIQYTAEELLSLRRYDVTPPRRARKSIFSYRLWRPINQRVGNPPRDWSSRVLSTNSHQLTIGAGAGVTSDIARPIPVVTYKRLRHYRSRSRPRRQRVLVTVVPSPTTERQSAGQSTNPAPTISKPVPPLHVLNAAALSKPGAVDLMSYNIDIAVITETHCKQKHQDSIIGIEGYSRRDRNGRRGGGVAVYVSSTTQSARWAPSVDNNAFELLWVHIDRRVFVAAFYYPPKPVYSQVEVLNYIELCAEEINRDFPFAEIVLAGDFNQLPDQELIARTGLTQLVHQLSRGMSVLDRVYVSNQQLYPIIRVVSSIVRSDHKAVVAYPAYRHNANET